MERDENKQKYRSGEKLILNFFHLDKVQRRRKTNGTKSGKKGNKLTRQTTEK